jgi:glycosyltransferase involved in cell wall biosynthesis
MYVYGGAELLIVKLANYMTKRGIENALLTTSILPEMQNDLDGTEIIIQENFKIPFDILGFNEILALHKGVRDNLRYFDVINVHNYPAELSIFPFHKPAIWMCNEPELYLTLQLKVAPFDIIKNNILFTFDKFVVRYYIKNVVVVDEFNCKRFREIYGFKPEIINYGIDYDFFSKGDGNRALKKFNLFGNFVVLQVGMLTPFKNQMESIKTVEKLKYKIPNIKLVLAGWGYGDTWEMQLKKHVKERNLVQNVVVTGHLSRKDIRDVYHACDVLLHPIKPQGGWLAPFEALCAKKPIVVSEEMTASNIIKREKIGTVTDDFAETIWDIYINPQKYKEAAERGQKWVRENLGWEKFCEKMVNVFCKAMEES